MGIDLDLWRQFVAVARTGSITAAAAELGSDQPRVSRALRKLERAVGAQLLERGPAGTRPTRLGIDVLPRAQALIEQADRLHSDVLAAARMSARRLRVGTLDFYPFTAALAAARQALNTDPDPVHLQLVDVPWLGHTSAVLARSIDLGFTLTVKGQAVPDLLRQQVIRHERTVYVLLPAGHRLAGENAVRARDLADEPLHLPRTEDNPDLQSALLHLLATAGLNGPRPVRHNASLSAVLQRVAAGDGWTIVAGGIGTQPVTGTVARPLDGPAPDGLDLIAIWHRAAEPVIMQEIAGTIRVELEKL